MTPNDHQAALYRRHRPTRFADVVGQDPVVASLTHALRSGRVAQSYLFSGPSGTGKTSIARILAMALTCTTPSDVEPCGACESCKTVLSGRSTDVVEVDSTAWAADGIRDLIAHLPPAGDATAGRSKVYILDHVEMLSNLAAAALLKTLEEPPDGVVFLLATTRSRGVPPTVRSRTQHHQFRLLTAETLTDLLRSVVDADDLAVTHAQLAAAVRQADGSARGALSALDALVGTDGIGGRDDHAGDLLEALVDTDLAAAWGVVAAATLDGTEPAHLAEQAVEQLREMFLIQMGADDLVTDPDLDSLSSLATRVGPTNTVRLISAFGEALRAMRDDFDPRIALEIALAHYCRTVTEQGSTAGPQ